MIYYLTHTSNFMYDSDIDKRESFHYTGHPYAGVVKLVDAEDSKSSDLTVIRVRFSAPAPTTIGV